MLKHTLIALAGTATLVTAAPALARDRVYDERGRYIEPRAVSAGEGWQGRGDGACSCSQHPRKANL